MTQLRGLLSLLGNDAGIQQILSQLTEETAGTIVSPAGIRPALAALAALATERGAGSLAPRSSAGRASIARAVAGQPSAARASAAHSAEHPFASHQPAPVVVVTATSRHAERFAKTARAFIDGVELFPAWETLPHERLSPQLDTMACRVALLRRLTHPHEGEPLHMVVVPARAFLQPIAKGIEEIEPVTVRVGQTVDRERLVSDLVNIGYEAVDLIERRGQVAARGSIVDIYVPTNRHPLRIELFGDEVEEIRWFNLSDQRTVGSAELVWAAPTRELLLADQVRQRARELTGEYPGAADLLELAAEGIYAPGIESLSGVLAAGMRPFTALLPENTLYFLDRPELVEARSQDLQQSNAEFLQAAWGAAAAGGKIPLQVEQASFAELDDLWGAVPAASWWQLTDLPPAELAELAAGGAGGTASEPDAADTRRVEPSVSAQEGATRLVSASLAQIGARELVPYRGDMAAAIRDFQELLAAGNLVVLAAPAKGAARRLQQVFEEAEVPARIVEEVESPADLLRGVLTIVPTPAGGGFTQTGGGYRLQFAANSTDADVVDLASSTLTLLTEQDLTGRVGTSTREMRKLPTRRKKGVDPLSLRPGDYVVHEQHGVGRFVEIATRNEPAGGAAGTLGSGSKQLVSRDYLVIEYASSRKGQPADQLFVPTTSLDQISKYVGSDEPRLSRMGGADWARTKQRARKAVNEIAAELVRLYAARQQAPGHAFSRDTPWQRELEDSFEYTETPDQLATMDEVKADMEKPVPMDRLLTGDVGYGKTEIAVRAAFKAVQDGKQVAVLVPTTLLAGQHYDTFTERYAGFPVRVAQLSRFTSTKEAERVRAGLLDGSIDVVIGTHTLLTGQVRFKDLGLVVIDEEQRFGVEHKETLKAMRMNVDVLAMSATPIPRTLEMAVAGIREMSVLQTPPEDRQPVLTFVGQYEAGQVAAAIRRELLREGQVFYVHNRVESIARVAQQVQELVPEARVRVAHGKLSEAELERVIVEFWNHEFDVLVSTTIVETGLDISNANTLIVDRADAFGLSQLHQLRGRVGRGGERAYAYFFYPKDKVLTETALERLRTIAANTDLGSGIAIAQKDLELRGAGNLLGGAQSGHIEGVGFDLYVRMVADAVAEYKGEKPANKADVRVELAVDAHLPEEYVPSERLRLEVYGKIAGIETSEQEADLRAELADRYGPLPVQVERLFLVQTLRLRLRQLGIGEVFTQGNYVRFAPVELADSQVLRLKRLYPGAVIKPAVRQVLVPLTKPGRLGQSAPSEEALVKWVQEVVEKILVSFGKPSDSNNSGNSGKLSAPST